MWSFVDTLTGLWSSGDFKYPVFGFSRNDCKCTYQLIAGEHLRVPLTTFQTKAYGQLDEATCCSKLSVDCVKSAMAWANNINQTDYVTILQRDTACMKLHQEAKESILIKVTSSTSCFGDGISMMIAVTDNTRNLCCKKDQLMYTFDRNCKWH